MLFSTVLVYGNLSRRVFSLFQLVRLLAFARISVSRCVGTSVSGARPPGSRDVRRTRHAHFLRTRGSSITGGPPQFARAMCDDEARHNPLLRDRGESVVPDVPSSSDSDDSDVDLEGEAHKARASRWHHERERSVRAAREMHVLESIRTARITQAAMDRETQKLRLRLEKEDVNRWANDTSTRTHERAAERAADTLHHSYEVRGEWSDSHDDNTNVESEMASWRVHDVEWIQFAKITARMKRTIKNKMNEFGDDGGGDEDKNNSAHHILFSDVPWPPCSGASAISIVSKVESMKNPGLNSNECRKKAWRALSLRWHPDKFLGKFAPVLSIGNVDSAISQEITGYETHASAIAHKVRTIAQEINDAWSEGR